MIHGKVRIEEVATENLKIGDNIIVCGRSTHIDKIGTNGHDERVLNLTIDDALVKKRSKAMLIIPKKTMVFRHLEV